MSIDKEHITPEIEREDFGCMTPLMRACQYGDLPLVKTLIERGADINRKTSTEGSTTPYGSHVATFARISSEYLRGQTALMVAVTCQQLPVVKYLLKNGADINLIDGRGFPAFWRVVPNNYALSGFFGHVKLIKKKSNIPHKFERAIVDCFIEHGQDINFYNDFHPFWESHTRYLPKTILELACLHNRRDLVKYLTEQGAIFDDSVKNHILKTASQYFRGCQGEEENTGKQVIEFLLAEGADPNMIDVDN